jgi:heme exporter protein D
VALVFAQVWFFHYSDVFALGDYVWLVFVRDVLVFVVFVLAARSLRRRRAVEDEDTVLLENELPLRVPS